jgi:hypothetical protein
MTQVHTTAKDSLHGYHQWRESIVSLPVGTIIEWVVGYRGYSTDTSVKAGTHYKIIGTQTGVKTGPSMLDADHVYKLVLCDRAGRVFKRIDFWNVESIARRIVDGEIKTW